jgi:hypothetical protein
MSTLSNIRLRPQYEQDANPESNPPAHHDRLQLLRAILTDREWSCDPLTRARLERMAADLSGGARNGIDEAAWSLLAEETQHYLDYRRLGNLEAQLRGCARTDFRFTRDDWAVARIAEAELNAHFRHVRDSSYVPEPTPMFRIH